MSADGHAPCPACRAKAIKEYDRLSQALADQYGEVSAEEYRDMLNDHKVAYDEMHSFDPYGEGSLAEYFEFVWRGNVLTVSYGGKCRKCGFEPSYDAEKEFEV